MSKQLLKNQTKQTCDTKKYKWHEKKSRGNKGDKLELESPHSPNKGQGVKHDEYG